MARFSATEIDNYSSESTGNFFVLKNDKETAQVRILYGGIDDIMGYAVYRVEINGKNRYVNSLRAYNEPLEKDPFAMAGMRTIAKIFIPIYNIESKEVQLWERGKDYFGKITGLATRYNPLYNEIIEIERNGKPKDMQTTYQFYPIESSSFDISSIEIPNPLGTIILDKTYEEMDYYVKNGCFPSSSQEVSNQRTSESSNPVGRRTPQTEGRRAF